MWKTAKMNTTKRERERERKGGMLRAMEGGKEGWREDREGEMKHSA